MSDGIIQSSAQAIQTADLRVFGIALAKVISNFDSTGLARVKVNLPWLPGLDLWARVAMPTAGPSRGMFFMPQQDDEVLVAFNRGDVNELYVIGSLWNGQDKPPSASPDDSKNKRIIHTPAGHVITLDDQEQSITITSISKHVISITQDSLKISLAQDTASIELTTKGEITIQADQKIELKAESISLQGTTIDIQADATASINGDASCEVKGGMVRIN